MCFSWYAEQLGSALLGLLPAAEDASPGGGGTVMMQSF